MDEIEKDQKQKMHELLMQQRKVHLDREFYAHQRFDVILVTLGTAGIVFNFQAFASEWVNKIAIIASLVGFILTVISNLIGQYFSQVRHRSDEHYAENEIKKNAGLEFEVIPEDNTANQIVKFTNRVSLITFCVALIALLLALI